jgi:hypothetical protein
MYEMRVDIVANSGAEGTTNETGHFAFPAFLRTFFLSRSLAKAAAPRPLLENRIAFRTLSMLPSAVVEGPFRNLLLALSEPSSFDNIAREAFFSFSMDCSLGANCRVTLRQYHENSNINGLTRLPLDSPCFGLTLQLLVKPSGGVGIRAWLQMCKCLLTCPC